MNSRRSLFRQRFVMLVVALVALAFISGCSTKENERSYDNNKDDVEQNDVQDHEDASETNDTDVDPTDTGSSDTGDADEDADPTQDTSPQGCEEGTSRCSVHGNSEVCTDSAWQAHETCPFGCRAGECQEEVECNSGQVRCSDQNIEICNAEGSAFLHVATCAVDCQAGLCTGACTPGETRCNGADVQTCNSIGSGWDVTETCTTFCAISVGTCALPELTISADTLLDGTIFVDGPVVIKSGMLLHSPAGELNIYATSIIVESDARIDAAATGQNPAGRGADGRSLYCQNTTRSTGGRGGSYGTQAPYPTCFELSQGSAIYGSDHDAFVEEGSPGGNNLYVHMYPPAGSGGRGGGVIRLVADVIQVDGAISANGASGRAGHQESAGAGGGGSGGGILLAADSLTVTGTIEAKGGAGGNSNRLPHNGSDGGNGRIKLLYGSHGEISGTFIGAKTEGLLAPLELSSPTHPDPMLVYNDDFDVAIFTWEKPFPGVAGYHFATSRTQYAVPTSADSYMVGESKVLQSELFATQGAHYFHIATVNADSEVSTVESHFAININTMPPLVISESHPDKNAWYEVPLATFTWTVPSGDENVRHFYYVFDKFGDTIPGTNDTMLLASEKSLTIPDLDPGIWSLHLIGTDTQGRFTKRAAHYRVKVGEDPGNGSVLGTIVDQHSQPVNGATITVNRGLLLPETPNATSTAAGSFDFQRVPAGSWELRISAPGYETKDVIVEVTKDQPKNANITLTRL